MTDKWKKGIIVSLIIFSILTTVVLGYREIINQKIEDNKIAGLIKSGNDHALNTGQLYIIINSEDNRNFGMNQGFVTILVNDDISKDDLKNTLKKAALEELKKNGYEKIWVYAYGDKKFFDNQVMNYTHGLVELEKSGIFSLEIYKPKAEVPAEKEKDIYLDWFKTRDEIKNGDQAVIEKEAARLTVKKYNLSKEEFMDIYRKGQRYIGMNFIKTDILEPE